MITSNSPPIDQAHGLRRMFDRKRVQFIPVVSNPFMAFGGVMLDQLCLAFTSASRHVLVVDAAEKSPAPNELATVDLSSCIETLSARVQYLAAKGLHLEYVNTHGSTAGFLQAASQAAVQADVILVHASAADLCRMFGRAPAIPLLMAQDSPQSVTHAYSGLKLLSQRAGLKVHDLLLSVRPGSPRSDRIAVQLAQCADNFLGALVRQCLQIDPGSALNDPISPHLQTWVAQTLKPRPFLSYASNETLNEEPLDDESSYLLGERTSDTPAFDRQALN
jgi:hypothetical protein